MPLNDNTESMLSTFTLLASYNEWMNAKVYAAAATMPYEELVAERGAFFGSILRTLNHIVVGDRIWLRRFASHPSNHVALKPLSVLPQPRSLDEVLYLNFDELAEHRRMLDGVIKNWAESLGEDDLNHVLHYTTTKGVIGMKRFSSLVMHFFNHQTHHRGQVSTLLYQAGKDVGVTDLLALIPNADEA